MYLTELLLTYLFFFFNDTATTEIYTLSLHDALPICRLAGADALPCAALRSHRAPRRSHRRVRGAHGRRAWLDGAARDRKSTRLNSSHVEISYAVFCLKKKKKTTLK